MHHVIQHRQFICLMGKVKFRGVYSNKNEKFPKVNENLFCKHNMENELLTQTENNLFISSITLHLKLIKSKIINFNS